MSASQAIPGSKALDFPKGNQTQVVDSINQLVDEHGIDIVWPQQSARYDLSTVRADVHTPATPEGIRLINDKIAFTEWLGDDPYRALTTEAIGVHAVAEQIELAEQQGRDVCVKPTFGIYGEGYWHLMRQPQTPFLKDPSKRQIHPDVYLAALAKDEAEYGPQRTLVMDWLQGPEVSIDMLSWRGTPLIHAARTKIDSTHQRIDSDHSTIEHARSLVRRLGLHGVVSLQYMLDANEKWKILEINPRPAGGSVKSEDAGFGIISAWAQLLAGTKNPTDISQRDGSVMLESTNTYTVTSL